METRKIFHEELADLEQQLLKMGWLTGNMVADAVEALQQGDVILAEAVISGDDAVDTLNIEIEKRCMRLLALQQPMARDLRRIGMAWKVTTDLERVADHAVDIAKIGRKLAQQLFVRRPLVDIGPLADMAQQMLQHSLEAMVRQDVTVAARVCADDDQVDDLFKSLREQLFVLVQHDAALAPAVSYMLLVLVSLERVADHATNIAERAYFVETGHLEMLARDHRRDVQASASEAA